MAITWQGLYTNYTDHTGDASAANLTIGKNRINDTNKSLLGMHDWYFAEKTANFTSTANIYQYNLPFDYSRMIGVTIQIGGRFYSLQEVPSHDEWQRVQMFRTTYTSNIPELYHITGDQMEIYPVPSSTGDANNGTYYYTKRVVDMQYDDYSAGTVTLTNNSTVVTGSGTTFTASMVGRFIEGPDKRWYELATFTSTTVMGLKKAFQGTTGSAFAYVIGEISLIPEDYHALLWYQPVATYWMLKKEVQQAGYYQALYDKGRDEMFNAYSKRTRAQIMRSPHSQRFGVPDLAAGTWADSDWEY